VPLEEVAVLTFTLYDEDARGPSRQVHIDPAAVASVAETACRPAFGGWHQVAVISMVNGERFTVEDGARTAARLVREAKAMPASPSARRSAEHELTDAEVDTLLGRFDQTDPALQRRIIARLLAASFERDGLRTALAGLAAVVESRFERLQIVALVPHELRAAVDAAQNALGSEPAKRT
jgi:hypothetical protein